MTPLIRQLARRTLCAALALTPLWTSAAPLEPGAELPPLKLPPLKLNDQYDKPVLIGPATRVLLFTTEKSTSDWVIKALSSKASEHPGVVYVADISAMPSAIARMFAIPKLRELSFPVGLAHDAAAVAGRPSCCRRWSWRPDVKARAAAARHTTPRRASAIQPTEIP